MNLDWSYPKVARSAVTDPWFRTDFADLDAARDHIAGVLPDDQKPQSVSIFNVWWIPGRSFEVVYELHHDHGLPDYATVSFLPQGWPSDEDSAALKLLEWNALLRPFPSDEGLRALPSMLDLRSISDNLHARFGRNIEVTSWSLLSYLPRKRVSMCYGLNHGLERVAGKVHETVVETHMAMQALWQAEPRSFRMPEPIAYEPELGMRWERFIPGHRVDLASGGETISRQLDRLLRDLVSLHRMPLVGLPSQARHVVLDRMVGKFKRRVEGALPAEVKAIARLIAILSSEAERLPLEASVTLHGDFHTGNVLFDGDVPGFIDLDSLSYGEAAHDLALFASRLLLTEIVTGKSVPGLAEMMEDLPRRYRDAGGLPISDAVFSWYMAALLIGSQLKTAIRHAAPELPEIAHLLIAHAETILDVGKFRARDVGRLRGSS